MNGFRLVLCLTGLLTYVVTKHFTAPDEHLILPGSATQLLGVGLSLPESPLNNPAMLAVMGTSSNAEPAFLRVMPPTTADAAQSAVKPERKSYGRIGVALPELGRN